MENKKAAVFILLGQSNAVGHGIPMADGDIIKTPLKNVFGLSRENNQSFRNTELIWSGYTSFGMNLAEEQDNTYSIANCLASLWQNHIDIGNKNNLPDLYIIQIAIGAQGVSERYMWYPEREEKLIPGQLGTVDISLFPFCKHVFALLDDSFAKMNKEYEVIGLHWRGGESDTEMPEEYLLNNLENIYTKIFDTFCALLGTPPIVLHKIVCYEHMEEAEPTGLWRKNIDTVNAVFEKCSKKYQNVSVFDVTTAPQYVPDVRANGIFREDTIHFTPEVNMWIAEAVLKEYCEKTM